jgi:hypothetical protein
MRGLKGVRGYALALGVVTAVVASAVWVQLGGATTTSTNPDTIQYVQTTGNNGTYLKYVPGDGSKATTQSVTSGGGCATPSPSGVPILGFRGNYYPNGYTGTATTVPVGAYKSRTGVCSIPQAWSIEVNEGLVFSVGTNTLVAGRLFSRAQIQLQRQDKSTSTDPPVTGKLIESLAGTPVGEQSFSIPGPNGGLPITGDTGNVAAGFDSVEIRVLTPAAGSISVVGPTSVFTLASKICPGDSITTTSNDVSATLTFVSGSACKTFTQFSASSTDKSVTFLSQELAGAHMTATFDWGYFPYCRADAVVEQNVPACPPTLVDFGDGVFHTETYCSAVDPNAETAPPWTPPPWCTTARHVDYVLDPGGSGATVAHITETWDGLGDIIWRH